jgi:hypothetical protein
MVRMILLGGALGLAACASAKTPTVSSAPAERPECRLEQADLIANRALVWQEFDQQTKSPTSWRSLIENGCEEAATRAYADYLAWGPIPAGERWQTTARFHLGQSLAHAGRPDDAARIIATARRETEVGGLKWNLYVQGTVAFLTRDRPALQRSFAALAAESGFANAVNAGVLSGLLHCWERPYREAAASACITASDYRSPAED